MPNISVEKKVEKKTRNNKKKKLNIVLLQVIHVAWLDAGDVGLKIKL